MKKQASEGGQSDFPGEHIYLPPEGISIEELEKQLIQLALKKSAGNQTKAAKFLKMSRDTLRYRMKKFGLSDSGREGELEESGSPEADSVAQEKQINYLKWAEC